MICFAGLGFGCEWCWFTILRWFLVAIFGASFRVVFGVCWVCGLVKRVCWVGVGICGILGLLGILASCGVGII